MNNQYQQCILRNLGGPFFSIRNLILFNAKQRLNHVVISTIRPILQGVLGRAMEFRVKHRLVTVMASPCWVYEIEGTMGIGIYRKGKKL